MQNDQYMTEAVAKARLAAMIAKDARYFLALRTMRNLAESLSKKAVRRG